jgi:tetratricopeptide (TPR) repeat protein
MSAQMSATDAIREADRLGAAGRLFDAIRLYRAVLARAPELADAWYNLGVLERRAALYDAALSSYARALELRVSKPEEVHLNRAVIFADCLRDAAAAERELRAALALNPAYPPALLNLANLHEDLGRRQEAAQTYRRVLELDPHAYEALARLAGASEIADPGDPLIDELRAALGGPQASEAERASLGFALARALDACAQYREAFAAATAANLASRASAAAPARYDRSSHERLIDELIRIFPAPERTATSGTPEALPRPLFICGMFRSGSTLTERLLGGHEGVATGGELEIIPRLAHTLFAPFPAAVERAPASLFEQAAAQYRAEIARLFPDATWVTDKRPDNFLYLGLIRRLFPRARIVHTTRNALDNCLSIYFLHLDQRMAYALDLADIGHYYRQYRRLMAHWRTLCGEDLMDFDYDKFVREPRAAARQLFDFCGLTFEDQYLELTERPGAVKTASVWQVRQGLYTHASGRARHYAAELEPLAAELAGLAEPS